MRISENPLQDRVAKNKTSNETKLWDFFTWYFNNIGYLPPVSMNQRRYG